METLKELNHLVAAGSISRKEARSILGTLAANKVSLSLTGSVDEIQYSVKESEYSRLSMQKKREAWQDGTPELADKYNEELVRNRILPDLMRRMADGESRDDLLDSLRYDAQLSDHTMERIEAGLNHFADIARRKAKR